MCPAAIKPSPAAELAKRSSGNMECADIPASSALACSPLKRCSASQHAEEIAESANGSRVWPSHHQAGAPELQVVAPTPVHTFRAEVYERMENHNPEDEWPNTRRV